MRSTDTILYLLVATVFSSTSIVYSQSNILAEPLNARSAPTGNTLFTELPAERTGITVINSYEDPRMWDERYQEMVFGTIGTGVAVADYDKDGLPDVFLPTKTGGSKLYRNKGDWRFEDVTERSGLTSDLSWADKLKGLFGGGEAGSDASWDQGAVFADVDNDGWLDLYVTCFAAPNRLYMNQGDGTFAEEADERGLAINDSSGVAAFCDYDRDGWLDLYLQTNMLDAVNAPEGQPDLLLRNNGNGFFSDVTTPAGISGATSGHSATWWDYDEDGWPDLYVANDFSTPDKLYRNLTDRTFFDVLAETIPLTPYYSMGADLGDVDNDKRIDFFVADMAPTTHEKDQRGMALSRARELGKRVNEPTPQRMRNTLFLNTEVEKLIEGAWMFGVARTDWTWSTRFEDLDNDGFIDLHITNGMVREYHNADILNRVMGAISRQSQRMVMRSSPVMSEANLAFRNLNGKGFERVEHDWGLDQVGVSFGAAFGELDRDGDLDLIYSNYDAAPTVLRNDGQKGNRVLFALQGSLSNPYGVGATVRIETPSGVQTRQLVLARGYLSSSEPVLHFGVGKDEVIERATVQWPSGHSQIFESLPANHKFTIQEPRIEVSPTPPSPAKNTMFDPFGENITLAASTQSNRPARAASQALAPFSFVDQGPSLAVGDLNGDGIQDLVLGSQSGASAKLLFGHSDGFADSQVIELTAGEAPDGPILVEDFNGDGDPDLLVTVADPGPPRPQPIAPRLFINDGEGTFQQAPRGAISGGPAHSGSAAAADFNRDGLPDAFVGSRVLPGQYPISGRSALLVNRGGKLEDIAPSHLPNSGEIGLVTGSVWSDFDSDDWPDLIVTNEWGQVRGLRNVEGKRFEDVSEELGFTTAGTGLWTCLAQGDFNSDGRPDFIAGNIGLNTPYRASDEEPAVLFYGNFGGRGSGQLIEAKYEAGRLLPRRSRTELSEAIPLIARRFPSNDAFAAATLEEILGPQPLDKALRLEATQLSSGILLSQEGQPYRFYPLPWIAQIAPLQGIAVGDFNGDSNLDIAATQNLHSVDPAIGRFTGGLGQLLLGDGKGGFKAIEPAVSGLVIPGDGKYISAVDLDADGDQDLIATRVDSSPVAFRNRSSEWAPSSN